MREAGTFFSLAVLDWASNCRTRSLFEVLLLAPNVRQRESAHFRSATGTTCLRRRAHWQADHKRFSDFPFQYYRGVFSSCDLDDAAADTGDVHDDLADIYGELWHGLQGLDQGDGVYAAAYWRESYFQHWGHHASSAYYAIDEYYRRSNA
jgi:uncharacterized protein DUF5063